MTNGLTISGDNVHVYKYVDSSPFEIVCAETMELNIEIELIGATTPESGVTAEVRPRLEKVSLNMTGVSTSDNDADISIFYLSQNKREAHDIEIVFTDNNGSERTWRQDFYIEKLTHIANAGESAGYDLSMRGSGPYFESTLLDPSITGDQVGSGTFTVSGGYVQDSSLIGVSIVGVWREGTNLESMGISYSYNSGLGRVTPDPATTIDGQKVFIIWTY